MDENHSIVEIACRASVGKRLRDVGLRTEHHLNLLTIRRGEAQTPQGRRENSFHHAHSRHWHPFPGPRL
ncbi:MAG: hypothetical protein ACLT8E_02145 [Akkermansia sp.]